MLQIKGVIVQPAGPQRLERQIVTETDVNIARTESDAAKRSLDHAQDRLSKIVEIERLTTENLKLHERIRKIRLACDTTMTRVGACINFVLIPSFLILVLCHALGIPRLFWCIPLVGVLAVTAFFSIKLFRPDDAGLDSEIDSFGQQLAALQTERAETEAELSAKRSNFDSLNQRYESVRRDFTSRINLLRSTNWRVLQAVPFEEFLAEVFREWGYEVGTTKVTGDQGIDLVVSKDGCASQRVSEFHRRKRCGSAGSCGHEVLRLSAMCRDHKFHIHTKRSATRRSRGMRSNRRRARSASH